MKILGKMLRKVYPWALYDKETLSPKRCYNCLSKSISAEVRDTIGFTVCEVEYVCNKCGHTVQYWAYGSFDPHCLPKRALTKYLKASNKN